MAETTLYRLTFTWNFNQGYVDMAIPNYVAKTLDWLQYQPTNKLQYSPHEHIPYRKLQQGQQQLSSAPDTTPKLRTKREIYGLNNATLAYY